MQQCVVRRRIIFHVLQKSDSHSERCQKHGYTTIGLLDLWTPVCSVTEDCALVSVSKVGHGRSASVLSKDIEDALNAQTKQASLTDGLRHGCSANWRLAGVEVKNFAPRLIGFIWQLSNASRSWNVSAFGTQGDDWNSCVSALSIELSAKAVHLVACLEVRAELRLECVAKIVRLWSRDYQEIFHGRFTMYDKCSRV